MSRPVLEVADIFRDHGAAWRRANAGHVSLDQIKVMSAIEPCRTAALGGHVVRCEDCSHTVIAYNTAVTGIARSVRAPPPRNGSPRARPTCFRLRTSMCVHAAGGHRAGPGQIASRLGPLIPGHSQSRNVCNAVWNDQNL